MPVSRTNRREFIAGLGGAAAWPLVARGQQPKKVYRIGFLANDPTIPTTSAGQAFLAGLRESGFVEGDNIVIERRFAEGMADRYPKLIAELIELNPDVLITSAIPATMAAKRATNSIPIVMLNVADPLKEGIIANLAHPSGNVTGLAQSATMEIMTKRIQLLKDAMPSVSKVGVLVSPQDIQQEEVELLESAAHDLHIDVQFLTAQTAEGISRAFSQLSQQRPDAIFVLNGAAALTHRKLITDLAATSGLPVISGFREVTDAGGLLSYGADRTDLFRRAATYVAKILNGAKPGDLPVEQPAKYELVINLRTVKSLKLEIPPGLLARADEVIE